LRGPGGGGREVRHSDSCQRQLGTGYLGAADAPGGTAEPQAHRVVQGLSLPSGELEEGATGGGESRVPCWRVIPPSGVHRDQPGDTEPGVVRFYNKRGTTEQWI